MKPGPYKIGDMVSLDDVEGMDYVEAHQVGQPDYGFERRYKIKDIPKTPGKVVGILYDWPVRRGVIDIRWGQCGEIGSIVAIVVIDLPRE